jgi:hypothetical protein
MLTIISSFLLIFRFASAIFCDARGGGMSPARGQAQCMAATARSLRGGVKEYLVEVSVRRDHLHDLRRSALAAVHRAQVTGDALAALVGDADASMDNAGQHDMLWALRTITATGVGGQAHG